jgi:virulence-associated protein VapD
MNNDNNDVVIGSPGASPRARATFNTSPARRYNRRNYNGARALIRNYAYTNSNTNENNIGQIRTRVIDPNNLRRMRRARMSFVNVGPVRRRLSFGNNGNRQNSSNYIKNENQMKKNANENNKTKKIQWKKVSVKNLPIDVISTNNFKSGEKAVKINKLYLTPNSFRKLARMSMTKAINSNGNMVLFKNPLTRENVKKGDLKFVILKREVKK